jgi:Carboxypeptidase regulatory-like domain
VSMRIRALFCALTICVVSITAAGQQIDAPQPQRGSITGIVTDAVDAVIPAATIRLNAPGETRTVTTNESGSFELRDLAPGVSYQVTVSANGFADWISPPAELRPGQVLELRDIKLTISVVETTVAALTVEQLAHQQVKDEEKQRVFGVIPNFYVSYDKHPVPMTSKLKYEMAFRAATDIVSFAGDFVLAGINQAADAPDYQQGAAGFGQRFGAGYASSFSDVMLGGAVLPSLLHQDPRYFYQGTGTGKSRAMHAIASPFVCKGDNGREQFNLSSIGGDLIAASLQNIYYPPSNRGPGIVLSGAVIDTGGRIVNALVQEFILQKYTKNAKKN